MKRNTTKVQDKIAKLELQLSKICQSIYELSMNGRRFIPKSPYVLVRVLPKEHRTKGGIYIPEQSQNKPVYEGIVLDTWRPWTEYRNKSETTIEIKHESVLKIGDRIAFPHSEGLPVGDWLYDRYYRLVREANETYPYHTVLGILDYQGDVEVQTKLRELTKQLSSITFSGVSLSRGANIHTPNRA
jgi:co-chaperonin GroES (HSP10)